MHIVDILYFDKFETTDTDSSPDIILNVANRYTRGSLRPRSAFASKMMMSIATDRAAKI